MSTNQQLYEALQAEIEYLAKFTEVIGSGTIERLKRIAADIPMDGKELTGRLQRCIVDP